MPRLLEQLEPTARQGSRGAVRVLDGDDPVARAPDDEGGHVGSEVEAVTRIDPLAARARDRAHDPDERRPAVGVGESGDPVDQLTRLAALLDTHHGQRWLGDLRDTADETETSSAPGSAAARMSALTSRPSPPLETSTMRSTYCGNWYANCITTPPPSECPTKVARSTSSASRRSRSQQANAPME